MVGFELFGQTWEINVYPEVILALAALITAISGFIAAYAALKRTRKKTLATAEEDCREKLRAAYLESQGVAQELHDRRMRELLDES